MRARGGAALLLLALTPMALPSASAAPPASDPCEAEARARTRACEADWRAWAQTPGEHAYVAWSLAHGHGCEVAGQMAYDHCRWGGDCRHGGPIR